MVRLFLSSLARIGEDFSGEVLVSASSLLGAVPPHRALAGGTPPPVEIVSSLFREPFSPDSLRSPGELTQLADVLLLAFKKSLYPRARFSEAIIVMQ